MDEKERQKLNSIQNDITMLKLKVNEIIKLLKEVKDGQHNTRISNIA